MHKIENPYCYIVTKLQCDKNNKKMYCYINKKYYLCSRKQLIVLQIWQQQLSENLPHSDSGQTC